jgi:hypothetical protein
LPIWSRKRVGAAGDGYSSSDPTPVPDQNGKVIEIENHDRIQVHAFLILALLAGVFDAVSRAHLLPYRSSKTATVPYWDLLELKDNSGSI